MVEVSAATRHELRRHQQRQLVTAYLRVIGATDAASLGTTRPSTSGPRAPRPTPWATYEHTVDHRLSVFPVELLRHGPRLFAALPWADREVLRLCLVSDQSQAEVAATFGRSPRWVRLRQAAGLSAFVLALWDDQGRARHNKTPPLLLEGRRSV